MGAPGPRSLRGTSFPIPRSGSVWGCQGPTLTGICSPSNACIRGPSAGLGAVVGSVYGRHSGRSSTFRPWPRAAPSPGTYPRPHTTPSCLQKCLHYLLACVPRLPVANPLPCPACEGPAWGGMLWPPLRCRTHPWAFLSLAALCRPWPPTRGSPRTMCSSPVGGLPLSASCVSQQGSNDPAQGPLLCPSAPRAEDDGSRVVPTSLSQAAQGPAVHRGRPGPACLSQDTAPGPCDSDGRSQ